MDEKLTQKQLEQPTKYYQLLAVQKDVKGLDDKFEKHLTLLNQSLQEISQHTKGVVTYKQMTEWVDKRIDEKIEYLKSFKNGIEKFKWLIIALILTDIASRIL